MSGWLINTELQGKPQDVHEPILITKSGILVAGFAEWHAAVCAGQAVVNCIEFALALNDDEALQLILTLHRPRVDWNDFIRTELSLKQEPYFQSKALANQIAGGKHKGLANLPKAELVDVREKTADLAGISSFGMESGSQRILDLIDKGTKVEYMRVTMKNFASSDIACQLMAFTDFPTETEQEKEATRQFIRENQPYWSAGGLGTFLLTGTSIIARNPEKFGIELIEVKDVDSPRGVAYRLVNEAGQRLGLTEASDSSFDNDGDIFPAIMGRPWAGGTDSLHTMIYYNAFGKDFFKTHPAKEPVKVQEITDAVALESAIVVNGELVVSCFDLSAILLNRKHFLRYVEEQLAIPAEPTYAAFRRWAANIPYEQPGKDKRCWIITLTRCVKIDKLVFQLLQRAAEVSTTATLLLGVPEPIRSKLLRYLKALEHKNVISFRLGGQMLKSFEAAAEEERRRAAAGEMTPQLRITRKTTRVQSTLVTIQSAKI